MWPFYRRRGKTKPTQKHDEFAREVRVKGATRPQHRQREIAEPQLLQRARTERIIHAFLSADNWDATYATLQAEQATLLSDEALEVLRAYIEQTRERDHSGQMVDYLEAHRLLLERARLLGVPAAWEEFRQARLGRDDEGLLPHDPETQATIEALRTFLATESWSETYALLERDRDRLLSDTADEFLSALISVASQDPSPQAREGVRYLELHLTLLRETRRIGLARAWEHFDQGRRALEAEMVRSMPLESTVDQEALSDAARALRSLLNARSWGDSHAIIEREQTALLTDTADRLLENLLESARQDPDPRAVRGVVYLGLHLRLLRAARRKGVEQAWTDFEDALREAHVIPDDAPPAALPPASAPPSPPPPRPPRDLTPALITQAVDAFLNAGSWEVARGILIQEYDALVNDRAVKIILEQAEALRKRGTGRDLYAARLLHLQARLLRRAGQVGLDRAWAEFEAERD